MSDLLALDCPSCGAPLPGLDGDVAFACHSCGRAREIVDGELLPRPLVQVDVPQRQDAVRINLPVWRFEVQATAGPDPNGEIRRAAERAAALQTAYVLAAVVPRSDVFGDWGHRWTALQPSWGAAPYRRPLVGVGLASADAAEIARHYILELLDRVVDLDRLEPDVRLAEPSLLALPVYGRAGRVESPWGAGLVLPGHALDAYVELLTGASFPEDRPAAQPRI